MPARTWSRLVVFAALLLSVGSFHKWPTGFAADDKSASKPVAGEKSLDEELQRIKPLEPAAALQSFQVQNGFSVELVAHEPAVTDPVDVCFDEFGRMYVAEMHGYPFSSEPREQCPEGRGKHNADIIRLLEDTDGDGFYDKSSIFADDISWATSVCCYNGGVFVTAAPNIYYFKDTDGDRRADVREIVYSGFGRSNVQGLLNNLKWGLDNHIWGAGGRNGGDLKHRDKDLFALGNQDFRIDPKTEELNLVSGGQQHGHSFDDWGNRFICSNSDHMLNVVFANEYLERNPFLAVPGVVRNVAREGGSAPVFRISQPEPWRIVRTRRRAADPEVRKRLPPTELVVTGFFTSAAGVTIYRGDAYPAEYRGNAFIGDVGGNLVHRKLVDPKGATFESRRADQDVEFIASTDNWFRPVSFVNAPDGTLFILDMYRETIEHPFSIPDDIKAHLDLESGDNRGRIYRIVPPNWQRPPLPNLGNLTNAELVPHLASTNGWTRETAQRLLWERQDKSVVPAIVELLNSTPEPLGRVHALWTLDGLGALTPEILLPSLADAHHGVREQAVKLSEQFLTSSPELAQAVLKLADDPEYRVRFQVAFSLGSAPPEIRQAGVSKMLRGDIDRDMQMALLTSSTADAAVIARELLIDEEFLKSRGAQSLLAELSRIVGAQPESQAPLDLLDATTDLPGHVGVKRTVIQALGEGLSRRGASITQALSAAPADSPIRGKVLALFTDAAGIATDAESAPGEREAAAEMLAFATYATAGPALESLLTPQSPQELQQAAVAALGQHDDPQVASILLTAWSGYTPAVRRRVVDALLGRPERIEALLAAVETEDVPPGELERDSKSLLTNHPNKDVRDRAAKLFGSEVSTDRARVVGEYQSALSLTPNREAGEKVFKEKCSICHKVGAMGHEVGPNLASTQNKSPADMLISLLDPSREAQPNFSVYSIATLDGRIFNGIIVSETAASVTLRRAEGKEDTVLRSNIDSLSSNGKSLMPEGLEKELTPQMAADVIEFIRTIPATTK